MLFTVTLAAGEERKINLSGNAFFVNAAGGPVEFLVDGVGSLTRRAGQGAQRATMFDSLLLKNLSALENTVELDIYLVDTWELHNYRGVVAEQAMGNALCSAVTVGLVAVSLTDTPANNVDVIVMNNGAATIYVGPGGVTTATGIPVAAGQSMALARCNWEVFAISGSAGNDVRVLIQRV